VSAADAPVRAARASAALGAGRWQAILGSVALAALGYLGFSLWGGWHEVASAVARVGWGGVAALLALSALNYLLRFGRWQVYLRQLGTRIPWAQSLAIYLAGFSLTTTPGKAGEAVRSVFLKQRGMPYIAGMAAFVSERLSDLIGIVVLACIGLADHPEMRPLVLVAIGACLVVLSLLSAGDALAVLHRRSEAATSRSGRAWHHLLGIARAAKNCHRLPVLLPVTLLSVVAWSCEALAFHLLLRWLGMPTSWGFSFFVYAVGMLAGALSFLPGGLGSTEAVMVGLLLWSGHPQADSVAAIVLIRVCTLWFAVLLGLVALPVVARSPRADAARGAQEGPTAGEAV
jgi:uncharacterized protein (TIRG00374 family)